MYCRFLFNKSLTSGNITLKPYYMKKAYFYSVLFVFFVGQIVLAQSGMDAIVTAHLNNVKARSGFTTQDIAEWKITDVVPSLNPAIQHVYVQQLYRNIPIQYATYKLTVKNGKQVTWEIDQFAKNIADKVATRQQSIAAEDAIKKVANRHSLQPPRLNAIQRKPNGNIAYTDATVALEPIEVTQVYVIHNDELHLTWKVSFYQKDGTHWWNDNVDVETGKILHSEDWVISCNFDAPNHSRHIHTNKKQSTTAKTETTLALAPNSYNVYAVPLESPDEGNRSIVTDPADSTASPYGWHDTNGSNGAEFTITRGNNVWAQDDSNGNNGTGAAPDGGASLEFDYPLNLNSQPSTYRSASTTNLFYWNNIMHDVWYQYGFDEASGNFQENNYGNGGAGSDSVNADAQDGGGTNNANFSTPPDGRNPRMQMFLWNRTQPNRDGDFDNVIIAHEYGHGISIRLVGGPSSNTLGGSEQMGEGWSDWFGLMLTMKPEDKGTDGRGVGTYVLGEGVDGTGIRPTRYSTNRGINDTEYADIGGLTRPHGVGYAFATILWDMTWALIDAEGFDPDLYNGTGGNNIAMALVIEGLKNTANNPGFVSGRDGILQADQDLYGGQYNCIIWKAFAERGVGQGANENNNGGTNGQSDQTVSFTNPCDGGGGGGGGTTDECTGDVATFPYTQSFEGTLGAWSQTTTGDDLDWVVDANGTPSNGTGPSDAIDGDFYIYVEASGNGTGYPSKRAILNSPCLDFSTLTSPVLNFQYHMVGSAIGTLALQARTDNEGEWVSLFTRTGAQGTNWNTASIDLISYAAATSVQLRLNVVTGSSWQGDIAIDNLSITEADGGGDDDDTCEALDFNDFEIRPFSNQDSDGDFSINTSGTALSLSNNTWKYIALNYTITENTVIQFDFSSTSEGEIHGVGFENDNELSSDFYFKVYGTQNYGVTNFDNYAGGTQTYVIPVGDFYTGAADRVVFINDQDAAGNTPNSLFSNVKIYEGTCGDAVVAEMTKNLAKRTPIIGTEDEEVVSQIAIIPNPTKDHFQINVSGTVMSQTTATIYTIMGSVQAILPITTETTNISAKVLGLATGMYILKVERPNTKTMIQKLIVQ